MAHPTPVRNVSPWVMLLALTSAFALSQAFRTVAAMLAPPLKEQVHLSALALGTMGFIWLPKAPPEGTV